jgi:hypothetical protein
MVKNSNLKMTEDLKTQEFGDCKMDDEEEINEEDYLDLLPEEKGVRLLWFTDYWDGPLAGVCEWEGSKYSFSKMLDHQWFLMYPQSAEEWRKTSELHAIFQKCIGYSHDYVYDETGKRSRVPAGDTSKADWSLYNKLQLEWYAANPPVAYIRVEPVAIFRL